MKQKIILLVLTLAALSVNATDVYNYTFETTETTPTSSIAGWVVDNSLNVVNNPSVSGINTSTKCLVFEAQSGIEWWGGIYINLPATTLDSATAKYVYLKVRAESKFNTNFELRIFNGSNEMFSVGAIPASILDTTWVELCYKIPGGTTFDKIRLQPRHAGKFYVDDVRLSDVAPTIPNLRPFSITFETAGSGAHWTSNFTGKGATYLSKVNDTPYTGAVVPNTSDSCMRVWIENGGYSEYGGGRYTGVYGYTTDKARYLHVRYYYNPNDTANYKTLPLWVQTEDGDNKFESTVNAKNTWNDVTIDLGVGTLVKFLNFTFNGWWITAGLDDIQLDGNPIARDNLTSVATVKSGSVKIYGSNEALQIAGVTEPTRVLVYGIQGAQYVAKTINADASFSLQSGIYIVKVQSANNTQVQKVVIK
jgi:hypothetical protein